MNTTELQNTHFKKLVSDFKNELVKADKPASYVNENNSYVSQFLNYVQENGIENIKQVDQSIIESYERYLEEERLNQRKGGMLDEASISKHKNAIRCFWKYLFSEKIPVNTIRLKQKRKTKRKQVVVLTQQEIEWLYSVTDSSAIGYRDRAMIAIYYGCGMRKSEGLRLLISDIDFNKERIHIRKSKNSRERYVMMPPTVQKQIEEYVYSYRDFYLPEESNYEEIFIGERGKPIHAETVAARIESLWKRVKDRYGSEKHIGVHTLRHSIGTHLYMGGLDVEMIALHLGHRTLEATQLYIHLANELKNKTYEQI